MSSIRYKGHIIEARTIDHFVNATQMCKAVGKDYNTVLSDPKTQAFIKHLIRKTGIDPVVKSVPPTKGSTGGWYVHKALAHYIACHTNMDFYTFFLIKEDELFKDDISLTSLYDLQAKVHEFNEARLQADKAWDAVYDKSDYKKAVAKRKEIWDELLKCNMSTTAQVIKDLFIAWTKAEGVRFEAYEAFKQKQVSIDKKNAEKTFNRYVRQLAKLTPIKRR